MNSLFKVHKLNAEGMQKALALAEEFDALLEEVLPLISHDDTKGGVLIIDANSYYSGREIALFKTHLELASFYAKKALAQQPENHQQ